jgi:hypothetical protein
MNFIKKYCGQYELGASALNSFLWLRYNLISPDGDTSEHPLYSMQSNGQLSCLLGLSLIGVVDRPKVIPSDPAS